MDLKNQLANAGEQRDDALAQYNAAMTEVRTLVAEAREQGISITSIANLAGVTRQTVYDILKEQK